MSSWHSVDLVYAHRPDRNTPIEETVRAFNYLINAGKAFYWGTSEWNADEIATAWRYADKLNMIGPLMEQPQYNLLAREKVEKEFALLYEQNGLGLTIFSPLKMGILTGKYNEGIPSDSRLANSKDNWTEMMNKKFGDESWKKEIEQVKKLKVIVPHKHFVVPLLTFLCLADCGQIGLRPGRSGTGLGSEEPERQLCDNGGVEGRASSQEYQGAKPDPEIDDRDHGGDRRRVGE